MGNESQHLWATASVSSMVALKYIAHLLSLLRPLRFVINVCNKCVTLTVIVINGNDDPKLFSDSSIVMIKQVMALF